MTWKDALEMGVNLFKQNQYEEALVVFTQAIRENGKEKALFDSRAAVFEKLNRPADALEDCKRVIDFAPTSWQGYVRSARLFQQINRTEASLKMVEAALERVKPTDMKRRVELEALREHAIKALQPPPCWSNAKMLALTLICRQWRQIILDTPNFWRHLVVSRKTTHNQVVTWLDRAIGVLSSLRIVGDISFAAKTKIFERLPWSSLDFLDFRITMANFDHLASSGILKQLRLQRLHLDVTGMQSVPPGIDGMEPYFWPAFDGADTTRLRSVDVTGVDSLAEFPFTTLTRLVLYSSVPRSEVLDVLELNQGLETLLIGGSEGSRSSDIGIETRRISLPNLRHFHIRCHDASYYLQIIQVSKLKTLHLGFILDDGRGLKVLASQPLPLLEELYLAFYTISSKDLVTILQTADVLKVLSINQCAYVDDDEVSMIETLSKTKPTSEGSPQSLYCPCLQHVTLIGLTRLKADPVVRLVKAHSRNIATKSDGGSHDTSSSDGPEVEPSPILSLNVDLCPMIDADALSWLRANVPGFTSRMTPV